MTDVGTTINKGDLIPEDVTQVVDCAGESWSRSGNKWQLTNTTMGLEYRALSVLQYAPLTVTAVREPERKVERAGWPEDEVVHYRIPGDASPLTLCGLDVWADDTSVTERAGSSNCPACREAADEDKPAAPERKLIGPPHAHLDAPCTDECYEPSPKAGSGLLDLVRQYGERCAESGSTEWADIAEEGERRAAEIFDRIAALVPDPDKTCADCGCTNVLHRPQPEPELPPDVDELSLLALVRLHGESRLGEMKAAMRGSAPDQKQCERETRALFERIAALVPQQPVQARDRLTEVRADRDRIVAASDHLMGQLRAQLDEARAEIERLKAAQPDPSVLSLPQVPPGTVALITRNQDGDEVRFIPAPGHPGSWVMASGAPTGDWLLVEILRAFDGSVTVVKREPRTWPQLDDEPEIEDPPAVVDVGEEGRWRRLTEPGAERLYAGPGDDGNWRLSLRGLRNLGDVTEVFE